MKPLKTFLILSIFLALAFSGLADITAVEICDPGVDLETVRVCYKNNTGTAQTRVVDSITKLNRINQKPTHLLLENLTFIYEQPSTGTAKNVSIILALDITSKTITSNFNNFASSLLAGQRLMLIQNNEYYLLEHPTADLFSMANLKLTHIPTLNVYPAVPYQGTDSYVFNVLGGRQIELRRTIDGKNLIIRTAALGEAPAAYVIPHHLTEEYEVKFNYNNPVNIIDPASLGTITVCQDDNPRDAEQIKICRNNNYVFTLRKDLLTKQSVSSNNYLFLFTINGGTKQISLFKLENIDSTNVRIFTDLNYDNLINNLVAGRRLGVEFKENLYLLSHPVTSLISLPNITLKSYTLAGTTTLPTSGSEAQIEFVTLDGGKMYIKRNYGSPPPPFDLWALEQHELAPINLNHQLFTSFSSLGTIRIIQPNIGNIAVKTGTGGDIRQSQSVFKLTTADGDLTLNYREPKVVKDKALFYYHTANVQTGIHVKSGSVYRYYDLDKNIGKHYFNDTFIDIITGGNELALKFNNTYYLLGHDNAPDEPVFFDLSKLLLKTIDGGSTFLPNLTSNSEISFIVPGGRIFVKLDEFNNEISFSSSKKKELETITFGEEYSIVLTTSGRVKINDVYLELCNLNLYQYVPAADVCVYSSSTDSIKDKQILVDKALVKTVNGIDYLFEPNGLTGNEKEITVRKLIFFNNPEFGNWDNFIAKIVSGDVPLIKAKGQLYLPVAVDNLLTNFALRSYFDETIYSLKNGQQTGPVIYNGTFTLNDTVVLANQTLSGPRDALYISTTFTVKDYQYLPDSGEALIVTSPQRFITSVSGDVYTLTITAPTQYLANLKLTDRNNNIIFNRNFASGESRMLWLDNVLTEIILTGVNTGQANVTIQRVME